MDATSQQGGDRTLCSLDTAINILDHLAVHNHPLTETVVRPTSALMKMIRVRFLICDDELWVHCIQDSTINDRDYIELGLSCARICSGLHWGVDGKKLDDLTQPLRQAINQLRE